MRIYALSTIVICCVVAVLIAGCPAKKESGTGTSAPATSSATVRAVTAKLKRPYPLKILQADEFPPEAVAYLEACLDNLSNRDYPPKDLTFYIIGMLQGCQVGRDRVLKEVELSGEMQAPALTMAYLAEAPEDCLGYIRRQVLANNISVLTTVGFDDEVARWVMEHVDLPTNDQMINTMAMEGIEGWDLDYHDYLDNLRAGLEGEDPFARNVLLGFMLKLGEAGDEARQELVEGLASDDMMMFTTASEGMRKSDDPWFVSALEPYVLESLNRTEPLPEGVPDKAEVVAYTLITLEGDEAHQLRMKLLDSDNDKVLWMAAMGELLHGEPKYFNNLVSKASPGDPLFWIGVQAPDIHHKDLLPALDRMMDSEAQNDRFRIMDYLLRFQNYEESDEIEKLLRRGINDESELVREQAWKTAAMTFPQLFEKESIATLTDQNEKPKVRIAAMACAMRPAILRANGRID